MPVNSEAKQHVHKLVERLGPDQIAAVLQLLEVMVDPEEDQLSKDEIKTVAESHEYFRKHPDGGVSFEQFAAECGFTMDQILNHKD